MSPSLSHAWGGIWRLALRRHFTRGHWLGLGAMLAVFGLILRSFLRGDNGAQTYLTFVASFYFTFLVPLLAFISGGGAWRDDLKPQAADYFFLRPVPKGCYLLFRYGAQLICAQIDFLLSFGLLLVLGAAYGVPNLAADLPAMLAAQVMLVAAFTAFGFFCAALTGRWVIIGLIYAAVIEGGVGSAPLAINRVAMTHQARAILPALTAHPWAGADPALVSGGVGPWTAAGILALFALGWTVAAAAIFARDELMGDGGSD